MNLNSFIIKTMTQLTNNWNNQGKVQDAFVLIQLTWNHKLTQPLNTNINLAKIKYLV